MTPNFMGFQMRRGSEMYWLGPKKHFRTRAARKTAEKGDFFMIKMPT